MIPYAKKNLISLYRDQEYSKSREGYLCLDRNERQIPFSYGFKNSIDIDTGLEETIEWYINKNLK